MTLRHLEVFLQVLDSGSMRAAAEALYISQPSVSGVVADLEREYAVRLFERLGHKLYLTEAGKTLEKYSRHLLSLAEEMTTQMHNRSVGTQLHIGATVTVGSCVLCPILAKLGGTPHVVVNNTRYIEQLLLQSVLDIGLIEGRITNPDLIVQPVMEDTLVLACTPDHPFAHRKSIPISKLQNQPIIMRESGSGTRSIIEQALAISNTTVDVVWECNNLDSILSAVKCGLGLSVLSFRLLENEVAEGNLVAVPITGCNLHRQFSLVYHRDKFISPSLSRFIEFCSHYEK